MNDIIEIDQQTGEIILSGKREDLELIKLTKIKAVQMLSKNDFIQINGTWEAKRDGLLKILSSLPINYSWSIKQKELTENFASVLGVLTVTTGAVTRSAESIGICEQKELRGVKTLHNMSATSETRALKRAIEVLFGSVINYYVMRNLR